MFWLLGQSSRDGTMYGALKNKIILHNEQHGLEFCLPLANQEKAKRDEARVGAVNIEAHQNHFGWIYVNCRYREFNKYSLP